MIIKKNQFICQWPNSCSPKGPHWYGRRANKDCSPRELLVSGSRRRPDRGDRPAVERGVCNTRRVPWSAGVAWATAYRIRLLVCAPGLGRGCARHCHDVGSTVDDRCARGWWRHPPPPPPPQPQQADDESVMSAAYELKADRVSYINNDSKMMKVAYTRRWVVATTKSLPAKQSASDWTWSSTSSEMSASSSLQAGIATTMASQVRGRLAGRTVSWDDVAFRVLQELSDVFYMAMLPEFQDSIIDEVLEPATLWGHAENRLCIVYIRQHYITTHTLYS